MLSIGIILKYIIFGGFLSKVLYGLSRVVIDLLESTPLLKITTLPLSVSKTKH